MMSKNLVFHSITEYNDCDIFLYILNNGLTIKRVFIKINKPTKERLRKKYTKNPFDIEEYREKMKRLK